MKKLLSIFALSVVALTSSAQRYQQYFRVKFNVPTTGYQNSTGKSPVASTMKDYFMYCNPEHDYLDFQATDNPMGFRSTTNNYNEYSSFYVANTRNTESNPADRYNYPYTVDKIESITAYSIPVETVSLINARDTAAHSLTFVGNGKTYVGADFVFNRLPRNVAELKTLIEPNGDGVRVGCDNPLYVAAVMTLIWPRLLDCSQDCRDMADYLFGKHYKALNTIGVSNVFFQNLCTATYGSYVDGGGYLEHYKLFEFFGGATPGNQYKPNGKGYGPEDGPFKVRIVWDHVPTEPLASKNCTLAHVLLVPNPDARSAEELAFAEIAALSVTLRSTKNNGWFMHDGLSTFIAKGHDQFDDEF